MQIEDLTSRVQVRLSHGGSGYTGGKWHLDSDNVVQ
jgi:hypothetical protein